MSFRTLTLFPAIASLVVISIITIFAARSSSLASSLRHRRYRRIRFGNGQLYEDEDGTATRVSEAAFSVRLPKSLVVIFALLAVLVAVVNVIWTILKPSEGRVLENCLVLATWVNQVLVLERVEHASDVGIDARLGTKCHVILGASVNAAFSHWHLDLVLKLRRHALYRFCSI